MKSCLVPYLGLSGTIHKLFRVNFTQKTHILPFLHLFGPFLVGNQGFLIFYKHLRALMDTVCALSGYKGPSSAWHQSLKASGCEFKQTRASKGQYFSYFPTNLATPSPVLKFLHYPKPQVSSHAHLQALTVLLRSARRCHRIL